MQDGCATRWVCTDALNGLTRVDLSDAWVPVIFREAPELGEAGRQPYKPIYQKLAAERLRDQDVEGRAVVDRHFEPYGIFPDPSVVRARLLDAERHACRDAVDDAALVAQAKTVSAFEPLPAQRDRVKAVRALEARFTKALVASTGAKGDFGPADFAALAAEPKLKASVAKWQRLRQRVDVIRAVQDHMRCERLLEKGDPPGLYGASTQLAVQIFQRKHMLGGRSHLDSETRAMLVEDSRELDFRALLRVLRERVIASTGLIEDGSALGKWGTVMGRTLDAEEFRHPLPGVPVAGAAADLISPATEAAARALGWTSPAATIERLTAQPDLKSLAVAVALPAPPPWHARHMDLRAEIDRGDVWYDYPVGPSGKARHQPIERRPTLTLYARHAGRDVALLRWPTTIGGWKPEVEANGATVYKFKNSDVGPRLWRRLVSGPSWLPPDTTPDSDLVESQGRGEYRVKRELLGPSYASAFGLAMLIHEQPIEGKKGAITWRDNGIRTHGSVSYRSIVRGASHGCHRLFNHLAVRLSGFVLSHRTHRVEGRLPTNYSRNIAHKGAQLSVQIKSRGFGFALEPPVPVNVLEGRIRGATQEAPKGSRPVP